MALSISDHISLWFLEKKIICERAISSAKDKVSRVAIDVFRTIDITRSDKGSLSHRLNRWTWGRICCLSSMVGAAIFSTVYRVSHYVRSAFFVLGFGDEDSINEDRNLSDYFALRAIRSLGLFIVAPGKEEIAKESILDKVVVDLSSKFSFKKDESDNISTYSVMDGIRAYMEDSEKGEWKDRVSRWTLGRLRCLGSAVKTTIFSALHFAKFCAKAGLYLGTGGLIGYWDRFSLEVIQTDREWSKFYGARTFRSIVLIILTPSAHERNSLSSRADFIKSVTQPFEILWSDGACLFKDKTTPLKDRAKLTKITLRMGRWKNIFKKE